MNKFKTYVIVFLIILISPLHATLVKCTAYAAAEGDGKYGCRGDLLKEGDCAADPKYFPYDSKLLINKKIYTVKDTGGAIKGKYHIDIFYSSLKRMRTIGTIYAEVKILHSMAQNPPLEIFQNNSCIYRKKEVYSSKQHEVFKPKEELICLDF